MTPDPEFVNVDVDLIESSRHTDVLEGIGGMESYPCAPKY